MTPTRERVAYLDRVQAEKLARDIASFLETRNFAKNPHIGLIGPGTRGTEGDPIDLLTETIEEQTEQWLSPFVSGFRISLRRLEKASEKRIKMCYSFHVRISAPSSRNGDVPESDQFRSVDLCFIINNESSAEVSIVIYDGKRENILYSKQTELPIKSGEFFVQVPDGDYFEAGEFLTTTMETGYGSQMCEGLRFRYGFALTTSIKKVTEDKVELAVKLIDGEGSFVDQNGRIIQIDDQNKKCRAQGLIDREREPWSIAQLHELQSVVRVIGYEFAVKPTEHGIAGLRPINCAYDLQALNEGEIRFRDYAIVPEHGRSIRQSTRTISEFLGQLISKYPGNLGLAGEDVSRIVAAVASALPPLIDNSNYLYTFQEDCAAKVLDSIMENHSPASAVPMGVQTAGGKTLGFLTPISIYAYSNKCRPSPLHGVKAILFYPTKALINDQSDTIVKLLWRLNTSLRSQGYRGPQVTFGILHGDIDDKKSISYQLNRSGQTELVKNIRLKCPLCESQLQIKYQRIGDSGISEAVTCTALLDASCPLATDQNEISFFNSMVRATRNASYADPPDILVCTPDMINYRLFYDPSEHSIFGRPVKRCNRCGYTTAKLNEKGPCPHCAEQLDGPIKFTSPRIFVFDEAHQLRGSFGSQVSYVMSRLEQAVKVLSGNPDYRPVYVFSSATLAKPQNFIRDFFGLDIHVKSLVRAEYLDDASIVNRIHLFMVPKGYSPEATLVQTVKAAFHHFPRKDRHPNILIFVNSLAESNELIHLLRHHRASFREGKENLPPPAIDGHSTDYGSPQRESVEDGFTKGEVNVLVATSTLQVGVDFNRIDFLIVYGAPFFLSDYVQRIGRAGRKHAAVIASILPSKPIDFFFFGNYPLITELDVRDRALDAEAVRISRENETIKRRSAVRAFLDYLCTHQESPSYYRDISLGKKKNPFLEAVFTAERAAQGAAALEAVASDKDINHSVFGYIEDALRSQLSEEERRAVRTTIDKMLEQMVSRGITSLSALFNPKLGFLGSMYAGDLRQSDYIVKIEHPDLLQVSGTGDTSRERALAIAIGDYCPGQITSYRSLYFVVDHIETDHTMSSWVRNSLYRAQAQLRRSDL